MGKRSRSRSNKNRKRSRSHEDRKREPKPIIKQSKWSSKPPADVDPSYLEK